MRKIARTARAQLDKSGPYQFYSSPDRGDILAGLDRGGVGEIQISVRGLSGRTPQFAPAIARFAVAPARFSEDVCDLRSSICNVSLNRHTESSGY